MLPELIHHNQDAVSNTHQDLRAALLAGVPLAFAAPLPLGLSPQRVTAGELDRLEARLSERLSVEPTLAKVLGETSEFPPGYRAAILINAFTADMPLILEGLATRRLARQRLAKMIRPTLMYLTVVLWVAAICLTFFSDYIFPIVQSLRDDMHLPPTIHAPARYDATALRMSFAAGVSLLAFVLLLAWFNGGASRIASWLGGRRYRTLRAAATAVRATGLLVNHGVPLATAVTWACGLVGNERAVRTVVDTAVENGPEGAASADYLHAQATHLHNRSSQRLLTLSLILPTLLICGLGGLVVFTYSLMVLWPVFSLYRDLALPAF